MNAKQKSEIRFRHVNHLCDKVIKHLEPSHALVLLVGWRHADVRSVFRLSESRISECTGISTRHIRNIIHALVKAGALVIVEPGIGTRATQYRITGEPKDDTKKSS